MDAHYIRNKDERDYVLMLDNVRPNLNEDRALHPSMALYCLLCAPFDCLLFISW